MKKFRAVSNGNILDDVHPSLVEAGIYEAIEPEGPEPEPEAAEQEAEVESEAAADADDEEETEDEPKSKKYKKGKRQYKRRDLTAD